MHMRCTRLRPFRPVLFTLAIIFCAHQECAFSGQSAEQFNTTLGFTEGKYDVRISDFYSTRGLIFSNQEYWSYDYDYDYGKCPTEPRYLCMVTTPDYNHGPIGGFFVDNNGDRAAVTRLAFTIFQGGIAIDKKPGDTTTLWYDENGFLLGQSRLIKNTRAPTGGVRATGERIVAEAPKGKKIGSFRIVSNYTVEQDRANNTGFLLDDFSFDAIGGPCGDERDKLRKEYIDYKVGLSPLCENFTQSASNAYYQFAELNTGNYSWALLRDPLTRSGADYGLAAWVTAIGNTPKINSAYRNPKRNYGIPGAAGQSRHMYGDAVDLKNKSRTEKEYQKLQKAARSAGASYIEPLDGPCGLGCVHADWRHYAGEYSK
jgi:hypothetical protein